MAGKSCGGQTVTDKKIEARILSVFMDARPWQAVHKERKICRSALEGQMTGCWDNAEYALYCHGCGALSVALRGDLSFNMLEWMISDRLLVKLRII